MNKPTELMKDKPSHCPYCKKFIVGETRSFCRHCNEVFDNSTSRWHNTEDIVIVTYR